MQVKKSFSLLCVRVTLFTVFKCLNVVMVRLQTAARSEVRKHQKRNQRCPTPQVTPAALLTELLVASLSTFDVSSFLSSYLRWFSSINWHKLRMSQLDAPTVRLIRKASPKSKGCCCQRGFESSGSFVSLGIWPFCWIILMKLSIFPQKQSAFVCHSLKFHFLKRKKYTASFNKCIQSFRSSSRALATSTLIVSPSIRPRWKRSFLDGTGTSDLEPK